MAKKMLRKQRIAIQKLEERVLFDAAGAAEIVDAAAAAAAAQGAEAEAQADDADDEKSSEVIAPPEDVVENKGAEAEAEAEENAEAGKGAESEIIDSTELAEELADAVEDIEVEDLDDISPEDVADDIEVEVDDVDVESDEVVAFADAFAVPEVETPEVEERELVIISDYVKDADKIAEQLDENTDVLILKQGENPMDQINEYLDSQDGVKYDAIHVVSHGNAGYFLLNDSIVDAEAVAEDPASWKAIGEHLTADGDIMIYGCNVAGSEDGKAMIANIAELTGADVAASVDKVGVVNGWDLEFSYGIVDTENIVIEGGNFNLNNYTVVEDGSAAYTDWATSATPLEKGQYHFISNGNIHDDEGNLIERGQLVTITVTVTETPNGEGVPPTVTRDYDYDRVAGSGTFEWCIAQSLASVGDDQITVLEGNVINDGEVRVAVNGALTYNANQLVADGVGGFGLSGGIDIVANGMNLVFTGNVTSGSDLSITAANVTFTGSFSTSNFIDTHGYPETYTLTISTTATSADTGNIIFRGDVRFGDANGHHGSTVTLNAQGDIDFGHDLTVYGTNVNINAQRNPYAVEELSSVTIANNFTFKTTAVNYVSTEDYTASYGGTVNIWAEEIQVGNDFSVLSEDKATEFTPELVRHPVLSVNVNGFYDFDIGGELSLTTVTGGVTNVAFTSSRDWDSGHKREIITTVTGDVTIDESSTLTLGYGFREEFGADAKGKYELHAIGDTFTFDGALNGTGNLRITNDGVNNTLGDGTVNLTDGGGVQYDFVINNYVDLENTVYVGTYDKLTVNFGTNNISLNEAFFKPRTNTQNELLGRSVGTFEIAGSGVITMTGTYAGINTTIDVDWDGTILHGLNNTSAPATAEIEYVESGVQYVLGGNYYTLEVGTSMNKILAGSISVGINPEALVEVAGEPEASMAYLNKLRVNEWYTGSMILGTTLYTEGFDVTFYGQTVKQTGRDAQIYGTSGTVTYIASAVNDGGNNRVFYGGTYGNLTIGAAPARDIPYVGPTDADALDFTIDQDVTINGTLSVAAAAPVQFTKLHDFTVEVTGAVKNITGIVARDANLHFRGNVTGNITAIGAQRTDAFLAKTDDKVDIPVENINGYADRELTFAYGNMDVGAMIFDGYQVTFGEDVNIVALKTVTATDANVNFNNTFRPVGGSGVNLTSLTANRSKTDDGLWINFNNAIGGIGTVTANGYSLNFVENAGTIGTLNLGYVTIAGVNYVSDVTFADGVNLTTAVNIEGGDITNNLLHTIDFSGETSGNAVVDSYLGRSIITYNYDGDQTVFRGRYHDLVINGSGVKTINAGTGERDRVFVGGTLYANNAEINVAAGIFEFSAFDPAMTPTISINAGAQMIFGKASTDIVEFNGDIINAGTLTFEGQIHVTGDVTILENGTMSVDASAIGSIFDLVNNYGSLTLSNNNITIVELHNYNDLKVTDISVKLNVYNHSTGKIDFDLEATEQGNTFTFNKGQEDTYVQDGDNRLINGGTITVSRGTLALNKFTQGDRVVAEDGSTSWTYDNMQYNIAAGATLIFAATNVNNGIPLTGASAAPGNGAYLGNITNAGVFRVTAANAVFNGTVNNASGSRLETGNTGVTFNGDFIHAGTVALAAGAASDAAAITFNGNVSGAGKVAYDGTITYAGAEGKTQRILDGNYSNTVTIKGAGEKTVAGNVIFNSNVKLSSTIGGENGSVTFNGVTEGVEIDGVETFGEFTDALTVTYGETADKIYGGTYGNLTLNSAGRTVDDTFTAATLNLNGDAEITSEITVTDKIVLGENSATIFNGTLTSGEADADAVITGGKNGTVEFRSTTITGITVDALDAAASYTNDSADAQQILSGTYNNGIELTGTEKVIAGNVTVVGALVSTASALNLTANGASLKVTGTVAVDAISIAAGTTLNLILADGAEHNRLGTVDGSGLVTLGGTLNVTEKADNNGYLDIYGWVDEGTAGKINVNGGVVEFMGTIADYGAVTAYVTNSGGSIIDDNSRLQNLWVTITGDNVFTSQLKDYSASSKFMILAGAQLTVDSFIWTDPVSGNLVITDEVVAFQLVGDAKLIFAMDDVYAANAGDKNITVHNLILDNSGESKVIVNAGSTVVIDTQADFYGEGAISGNGNVTMSNAAACAGNGTFNMTGGKVVYGSNAFVYGGTYYDLTLNRNTVSTALEVTNAAVFSAAVTFADGADVTLSGTAHFRASATLENGAVLTFNENVQSTFSDSKIGEDILSGEKGSTVIYEANAGVLQGTYGDLVLNGDHDIDSNFIVRGDADFTSGIQSGSGDWEFRGNATGEINNEGTVTYSSISKIYGLTGTYNDLVADAANLYLAGITLNGTLSGKGTLTFEGENTYGDAAVADMADGSVVTYAIGATNVLKGNYANFKLLSNDNGDEIKLTNGDLTVRELAEIKEGVTFGATSVDPATITFAGTTKGSGTVNFTEDTTAVYGVNAAVFGGNYHNLNIADAHEINNDINVAGKANFGAEMTGSGMWVFNGTASGAGSVNNTSTVTYGENFAGNTFTGSYNDVVINSTSGAETTGFDVGGTMSGTGKLTVNGEITGSGSAAMDDKSVVEYASGLTVFNGSYSGLTLNGNTVNSEVTVNALATLNGTTTVTDTGVLTFAGQTNAKDGGEIDAQDYSKVQYNGTADVFAAKDGYFDLTLYGERAAGNAIDKSFSVNGHADITGTQILGDGIEIVFNGSTNADEVGVVLVLAAGAENTVIYNAGAAVYDMTYHNLTVNGDHAINKDIIVNNTATFTGVQSGSGNWVFNGTAAGTGSVNNTSSVTYGENFAGRTFGGSYNDIVINSTAAATDGFDVAGTMSGTGKLTVNGEITGSGSAAMDDGSVVEYASGLNVFNGSYSDLTLNGNTIGIDTVVTVRGLATLNGEQLVSANGIIDFAGTTNAKAGVGSLKLEDGSTVKYNGTADLFANDAYYNLTLYGERSADTAVSNSFTVNGKADITGTQILGDGIEIVFNGTTNANDVDAEVLVLADGAKNTIIYAQTAAVFGGTYYNLTVNGNHTINRNINVNGEAKFNGLQSGSGDWVFNGTVSGTGSVDNTGSVTYNTAVTGFGGSYNDINANADVTFASKVSVKGILTGAADVTVTFNAVADGTGSIAMADGSTVIYKAAGSKLLGGNYANLQLDAAGTAASAFVVTGKATLNAVLTVNAGTNIIFGGTTNAAELLDGENARINGADGSTVAYADGAAVFQGRYATLSLADGNLADGEMGYAPNKDNGNITITGNLMLASAGKLSGNFSFTLLGSAVNVESIEQTAGTVTYGSGASIIAGTYANFTLKGGADASGTLNYEMLGDVTVNGLSTIENFAVLKGKSGQTLRFLGTTNAADRNLSTPDALVMAADSTVEYALSAEVYNGSYGNFKLVATDGDVLVSNLKAVTISGSFKLDIADGYYLVFDEAVAADKADFYLTLVAEGDIWYTNAYLAGSNGQIIGTFYYGDIRIGGDYNVAHDYINAYTGEVTLNKDVRLSDHNIDVNAVAGKITLENPAFVNVKLVTGRTDLSAEYIDGHILEVATLDGKASAYHTLTINSTGDSRVAVDAGTSVKVSDNLIFRENGALLIDGNFQLGSAEKYASATVEQAGTNYITVTSEQTEGEIAAFYLKDGSILPALDNSSTGIVNIYAEDNVTIASGGVAFFNPEDEKILVTADISVYTQSGITNITAGDNFTADGMVFVAGGVLNLTAGNNAQFKGSAFNATEEGEAAGFNDGVYSIHITGGETTFDLGDNAVIYKNIYAIAGETTLNADSAKLKGETLNVTGGAVFNMNLGKDASAATSTIASDVSISGTKTVFNLGGYNNSIAGVVQVTGGAAMVVTGSNIGFTNEVTNAAVGNGYRWNTSTGRYEYLASDAEYYGVYAPTGSPTGAQSQGSITIASDGAVSFTGRVVSGGDFAIEKGEVTFSREFAVSDGIFSINGGKVFFENDVYVSAVYGNGSGTARETLLYIGGTANVTMAGSLYNWVRIPVGYDGTADTPVKQYGGPFSKDAQNKIHLAATLNSSHIYIGADAKVSVVEDIANIGVWGYVFFTVADKAEVTVGGNFANYSHAVSNFWSGNDVRYDYLTNLMGFETGFGSHPLKPDFMPSADSSGAYVSLEGDSKIQIEGETLNGAVYHGGDNGAWKDTGNFEAKGWSHFSIDSANNVFKGKFSNASFLTVNSAGNTFGDVDNSYFMEVHDSNSFGTITNTHELRITNAGAVVLTLVNEGADAQTYITGNADGMTLVSGTGDYGLTVKGGIVSIQSDLNMPINGILVTNNGKLEITAQNDIEGKVQIGGEDGAGTFNLLGAAGGTTVKGDVTIADNGKFHISTTGDAVEFTGNIANANEFIVDGSISVTGKISNSGKLTISKTSEISGTLDNAAAGNVLVGASAAGSVFNSVVNAGNFTNSANDVSYKTFANSGTFINDKGVIGVNFSTALTNSGTMKIDGEISATGTFVNAAAGNVYVYGLADFGKTTNSGAIYLEPLTEAHAATVKFGDLTHTGTITSKNDTRNAADIYFKGKTEGNGNINGFTGTLYYVYTGKEPITQTFYNNDSYDQVTVYVGNKSVTGLDYTNGLVTLNKNITFKNLYLDGGNLAIGDAVSKITLDASSFTEKTAGTITVNAGSTLKFSKADDTTFASSIANYGLVDSAANLILLGETSGNGLVNIASGKSITYAHNGSGEQVLWGFADGSSTNLIVEGSTKAIAVDMNIAKLTNNGADISVKGGATLSLGQVDGTAAGVDGFTVSTEKGAVLSVAAGTFNAKVSNAGTLEAGNAVFAGSVSNSGTVNADGSTFNGAVANSGTVNADGSTFNGAVDNSGTFTAVDTALASVSNTGTFNVNANVAWNALSNAGTLNLNVDTVIGSKNATTNTGKINVGGTLTVDSAADFGGTVNVNDGAALKVTGNGAAFETVVNQGLVEVTGNGEMTIAELNNGEQGAASTLKASGNGVANITESVNAQGDSLDTIYGKVVKVENGIINFGGKIDTMGVSVDGGKLSDVENSLANDVNNLEITVDGEDASFIIDKDSDEKFNYTVSNGAELVIDANADGVKNDGEQIDVKGDIVADDESSVKAVDDANISGNADDKVKFDANVGAGEGTITVDNADINVGDNAGNIVIGDNVSAEKINNGSNGNITVDGDLTADSISNAGNMTNNGDLTADSISNSGNMTNNGDLTADSISSSGDFVNNANLTVDAFANSGSYTDNGIADVDTFDNSGDATVSGSGSSYGIVDNRLGANFTLNGSGNNIDRMNNTGMFSFSTRNNVDSLNNFDLGLVYRDGVMWMMASDEGMSPEFFSDGHNSNFTALAHMPSLLDADRLDADLAARFSRLAPGKVADLAGEGHAVDLHALLGGELDFIGIESEVDELLHGEAPELDEEELADVLSEGEEFSDGFDVALSEIVSE